METVLLPFWFVCLLRLVCVWQLLCVCSSGRALGAVLLSSVFLSEHLRVIFPVLLLVPGTVVLVCL